MESAQLLAQGPCKQTGKVISAAELRSSLHDMGIGQRRRPIGMYNYLQYNYVTYFGQASTYLNLSHIIFIFVNYSETQDRNLFV